jgi:excisionase family DNA binding protein
MKTLHAVLTVSEVAQYLRIDEQTVYRLLRSGELRGIKAGREWRVHRSVLELFVRGESDRFRDLLTVEQAAQYMSDPVWTQQIVRPEDVMEFIKAHKLPATYVRGQWMLAREDLDAYVTPQEQAEIEEAIEEHRRGESLPWEVAKKSTRRER